MNLAAAALALCLFGAEPAPQFDTQTPPADQRKLLEVFRSEFVEITPGKGKFPAKFEMGSRKGGEAEQPVRTVEMRSEFAVAKYEVPQNLWQALMGTNPSRWKGVRNSVEMLTFGEAQAFCKKATAAMKAAKLIDEDEEIRLPSEAEWEYFARAGSKTAYSFGDDAKDLGDYAWSTENAAGNDPAVGEKKPNPWGLYDIHGYLWEWCSDHAHANYEGAPKDSRPWTQGGDAKRRVVRGGSWKDPAAHLTSSFRQPAFRSRAGPVGGAGGIPADTRDDAVGLRCVLAKVKR